ncbi:unnamed protein product, partial [Meganyctiphanes norvegica]
GGEWLIDIPPAKNKNDSISTQNIENKTTSQIIVKSEIINSNHNTLVVNDILIETEEQKNDKVIDLSRAAEEKDVINDVKYNGISSYNLKKNILKVLHITDPHYDPRYKIGSNAACHAPLCCNEDSGEPMNPSDAAGKWGDYRHCDSPKWLLENMYQHIIDNHPDIDYIMNTGDLVPHHIWKVSQQ